MKDIRTEMKNNLEGINSRGKEAENQINNLEYKQAKNTQSEQQKEKRISPNKGSLRSLWDNFNYTNIRITGMLGGEKKTNKSKTYLEK